MATLGYNITEWVLLLFCSHLRRDRITLRNRSILKLPISSLNNQSGIKFFASGKIEARSIKGWLI